MDQDRITLFSQLTATDANRYISKRFALEKYLGWTKDEIAENERMWREENAEKVKSKTGSMTGPDSPGLSSLGIRPPPPMEPGGAPPIEAAPTEPNAGAAPPVPGEAPPAMPTPAPAG